MTSERTYALASQAAADIDMENLTPGYDFGSLDDKPMDLMTLEQFELENPYTPPLPRRTANPLRATSKNGQNTAEFHMACDARGVLCDFVFHTVAQGCFDVELRLGGEYVDRIGQYASKKDAKEEICKKHLATVEAMPNFKKRKVNDTAHCLSAPAGLDEELWVNLIYGNAPHVVETRCVRTDMSQNTLIKINYQLRILSISRQKAIPARGHASCACQVFNPRLGVMTSHTRQRCMPRRQRQWKQLNGYGL